MEFFTWNKGILRILSRTGTVLEVVLYRQGSATPKACDLQWGFPLPIWLLGVAPLLLFPPSPPLPQTSNNPKCVPRSQASWVPASPLGSWDEESPVSVLFVCFPFFFFDIKVYYYFLIDLFFHGDIG